MYVTQEINNIQIVSIQESYKVWTWKLVPIIYTTLQA